MATGAEKGLLRNTHIGVNDDGRKAQDPNPVTNPNVIPYDQPPREADEDGRSDHDIRANFPAKDPEEQTLP